MITNTKKKKKRLIWQIFPLFLIITIVSLLMVTLYSTSYFKKLFIENSENELTIRTKLLEKIIFNSLKGQIKNSDTRSSYINDECREIGKKTGTRVTVIFPSGVVAGDSSGDIKIMENHMKRPEIMKAFKRKKGVSIRYSSTLDKKMMYVALPVIYDDKVMAVVRTSVGISSIDSKIKSVRNNIIIALLFTILISTIASWYVMKKITTPIEEMKKGAAQFAKGKLNLRLVIPDSEELSALATTMNLMAENLNTKINDSNNRSMELEAVHSSMKEGVIAIDMDERIITINDTAAKIFGFSALELKNKYILEVGRNLEFQKFIQKALATHKPIEEDIVIRRDEDLILNIYSTVLYDTDKNRMGTLIIFHDITRIRKLEKMHKEFASNVSHELKTPLTTIKGFIETLLEMQVVSNSAHNTKIIQDSNVEENREEYNKFLKIIGKNVNRMIELINDLLALSRLERLQGTDSKLENQYTITLKTLIQGAVAICYPDINRKNIMVDIDCKEDIKIVVEPVLMEQAIVNLVDNAVKYSNENSSIKITVSVIDSFINIAVKDKGCGIDREHLIKIFNRFYRVDKARSRHEGGTGLGLAIVKHIVQYHNGKVYVNSTKGKGSLFGISIPANSIIFC